MNSNHSIKSLSRQLIKLNPQLENHIDLILKDNLNSNFLSEDSSQTLVFEERHVPLVLEIQKKIKTVSSRLICVSKNLSSDDRLVLINNDIECISPDKFKEISLVFFEIKSHENKGKVLIVEDDENQIIVTEHILQNAGLSVKSITKGDMVLEAVESYKPDLILMDLYLDGMMGDDLVKSIRKIEKHGLLPIVFLTSDTSIETRMRVLNAGADDLLTKPINSELLVSALNNRMIRAKQFKKDSTSIQDNKQQDNNEQIVETEKHNVELLDEETELNSFFINNIENRNASIIWVKIRNKSLIQRELGFSGFKKLCKTIFNTLPLNDIQVDLNYMLTEGIYVIASKNLDSKLALTWMENLKKWFSTNSFSTNNKDLNIKITTILLSDIPNKKNIESLLENAEEILLEKKTDEIIIIQGEGREEKQFASIKENLEKSIKTRNFKWRYQKIIPFNDNSKKVYQIKLLLLKDSGEEFLEKEYSLVAKESGMQRVLDRFTFENAIRIIGAWEEREIQTIAVIKQDFSDYENVDTRAKILKTIKEVDLPIGSIIFQFSMENAKKYQNLLTEIGRDFKLAKIKTCLSGFKANDESWKLARTLKTSWINFDMPEKNNSIFSERGFDQIQATINKARILCYKVLVSNVNDINSIEKLKELKVDYVQSDIKFKQD